MSYLVGPYSKLRVHTFSGHVVARRLCEDY